MDPFIGSGTTAVVAKKLRRNFIGIDSNKDYVKLAKQRLTKTKVLEGEVISIARSRKELPKVPFGELVEQGIIPPGAILTDAKNKFQAKVKIDGTVTSNNFTGSIHQVGAKIQDLHSCNGWDFWHVENNKVTTLIDKVREKYRNKKSTLN